MAEPMKLRAFASTLREQKKVTLPDGHTLEARADSLAPMLADTLTRLLPGGAAVHCGWQTSELADQWRGAHEWWLLVGDELVKIHTTAKSQDQQQGGEVTLRACPLHGAAPKIILSYRRDVDERGERETLASIQVAMPLADKEEPFKAASGRSLDAFAGFLGDPRAAIARANRRPKGTR